MSPLLGYAGALATAIAGAGVPALHATDAANNLAMPLALDHRVDVAREVVRRLSHQRVHFGLDVGDDVIARAAEAAAGVSRPEVEW